ncbi:hypothetical protein HanIR_Chr07g0330821 [Helianthus annuus]|nr:hypothetical protein HanIR_Chr07g0330821 [Helianthus annuus]
MMHALCRLPFPTTACKHSAHKKRKTNKNLTSYSIKERNKNLYNLCSDNCS